MIGYLFQIFRENGLLPVFAGSSAGYLSGGGVHVRGEGNGHHAATSRTTIWRYQDKDPEMQGKTFWKSQGTTEELEAGKFLTEADIRISETIPDPLP
jgi:hypothetical protein